MRKKIVVSVAIILAIIILLVGYLAYQQLSTKMASVTFDDSVTFRCKVADTPELIANGLLNVSSLAQGEGMLFVFPISNYYSISMKNILIPLDIIFLGDNKTVLNVAHAQVQQVTNDSQYTLYSSNGQTRWIVAINYGIADTYGIRSGTKVTIKY
jgi:uncharacterized membrane protein (UPF0127 family)